LFYLRHMEWGKEVGWTVYVGGGVGWKRRMPSYGGRKSKIFQKKKNRRMIFERSQKTLVIKPACHRANQQALNALRWAIFFRNFDDPEKWRWRRRQVLLRCWKPLRSCLLRGSINLRPRWLLNIIQNFSPLIRYDSYIMFLLLKPLIFFLSFGYTLRKGNRASKLKNTNSSLSQQMSSVFLNYSKLYYCVCDVYMLF